MDSFTKRIGSCLCVVSALVFTCSAGAADPSKVLRLGFADVEGMDPHQSTDSYSQAIQRSIFEGLYEWDYLSRPTKLFANTAVALPDITDSGKTWTASETPLVTGLNQGVFSIAVMDADRLVIVGGDYDHPQVVKPNSAVSDDGGKTWKESSHRPAGYRWCVAVVPDTPGPTVFAVGPTGTDYSIDRGKNWEQMNEEDTNTIGFADAHRGWVVGKKGLILKFEGTVPGGVVKSLKK